MRKTMTRVGLGLALVVGAAGAAAAQNARPNADRPARQGEHRQRGERGMRGERRGGPEAMLLKGITLTDAQKTRLQALRKEQREQMGKNRDQFGAVMKEARDARERGDTATARAKMLEVRKQMDAQRERQFATLRTILTPDQQRQFDANVAEWKQRMEKRGRK